MDVESKTMPTSRISGNQDHATLREQTERVVSDIKELGTVAKASTGEAIEQAREKGRVVLSDARDQSRELMERTQSYVQDHPLKSLAGAAAVGAILALLIRK